MFNYREGDVVYFIGTDTEQPHLANIVHLFDEYPNEVRLDTIGVQDIDTIRPFNTFNAINKG
jgi:hypothetical protein